MRKINHNKFLGVLILPAILGFIWILFGFNTYNVDYKNYEYAYNQIVNGSDNSYFNLGFIYIIKLSGFLGLNYQSFLICISGIITLLLFFTLRKLTNRVNLTLILFIIYPLVFDIVQYRNFLGYVVCFYGLDYLYKEKNSLKNSLIYIIFVLIATSIHSSMIIYLIFLLVKIKNKNRFILSVGICFSVVFLFSVDNQILFNILSLIKLERFIGYEVDGSFSTFIQYLAVYVSLYILAGVKQGNYIRNNNMKILTVAAILLPFILLNGTSARFIRNIFILFYATIFEDTYILTKLPKVKNTIYDKSISLRNLALYSSLVIIICFVFYQQLSSGLYHDTVLKPILDNNLFW